MVSNFETLRSRRAVASEVGRGPKLITNRMHFPFTHTALIVPINLTLLSKLKSKKKRARNVLEVRQVTMRFTNERANIASTVQACAGEIGKTETLTIWRAMKQLFQRALRHLARCACGMARYNNDDDDDYGSCRNG